MPVMERVYGQFQLESWDRAQSEFQRHFDTQRTYRANTFVLPDDVVRAVNERWDGIRELHQGGLRGDELM